MGLTDFKRQCGKDFVDESFREATRCRVSVRIQSELESRWEADLGKLDLSDEAIVDTTKGQLWQEVSMLFRDTEQMRIAGACVKEPNSVMALALLKKTDQCSMLKDQTVFNSNSTISACDKKHVSDHGVTIAVSDARHRTAEECLLLQRGDHSVWESLSLEHCTEAAQGGRRARWRRE